MIADVTISALALGGSSLAGSLLGLIVKKVPHRWNDIFLGFCTGMMLAAAIVCLIWEAVHHAHAAGIWQVVLGVAAGVVLISLIDYATPHLHHLVGLPDDELDREHHPDVNSTISKVLLFVLAIAIHKLPEGMATGITFDGHNIDNAWTVTITIAVQNIPEGLVVVTPLLLIGIARWRALLAGLAIAFIELLGVYAGYYLGSLSHALLPALLAMAGGAMLYVLSDEMIPETHAHGFQKQATYALVLGVICLLFIQDLNF